MSIAADTQNKSNNNKFTYYETTESSMNKSKFTNSNTNSNKEASSDIKKDSPQRMNNVNNDINKKNENEENAITNNNEANTKVTFGSKDAENFDENSKMNDQNNTGKIEVPKNEKSPKKVVKTQWMNSIAGENCLKNFTQMLESDKLMGFADINDEDFMLKNSMKEISKGIHSKSPMSV